MRRSVPHKFLKFVLLLFEGTQAFTGEVASVSWDLFYFPVSHEKFSIFKLSGQVTGPASKANVGVVHLKI